MKDDIKKSKERLHRTTDFIFMLALNYKKYGLPKEKLSVILEDYRKLELGEFVWLKDDEKEVNGNGRYTNKKF
jgi:hypothetical protein